MAHNEVTLYLNYLAKSMAYSYIFDQLGGYFQQGAWLPVQDNQWHLMDTWALWMWQALRRLRNKPQQKADLSTFGSDVGNLSNIWKKTVEQMFCTSLLKPLEKCVVMGEARSDGSVTKLPCKQMPMGLLEHIANFFTAEFNQQVVS